MPNQFLDIQGTAQRITKAPVRDAPAQGQRISDGQVLQKVVMGPFQVKNVSGFTTVLPAKKGIKYLVHSVTLSVTQSAANAGTYFGVYGTISGTATYFCRLTYTANAVCEKCVSSVIDVIFDEGTAITSGGNAADAVTCITYQEIQRDDS